MDAVKIAARYRQIETVFPGSKIIIVTPDRSHRFLQQVNSLKAAGLSGTWRTLKNRKSMEIKLQQLVLENFRDISGSFDFNAGRNVFAGPNGCGKTTLFDAVSWLLDGKDSQGKADFAIKTIKAGREMHKADHSVYAKYEVDGMPKEFKRIFSEKYTKKRGAAEAVKEGHQTKYFFDGIEISKTAYSKKVVETFGKDFAIVSDIRHVAEMPWKDLRRLLISMTPAIDADSIIDAVPSFRELIGDRSVEDAKTAAEQRRKTVIKQLEAIPAQIAENETAIADTGGVDASQAAQDIEKAEKRIAEAEKAIKDFDSGDKSQDIEKLKKLNSKLMIAEAELVNQKRDAARLEAANKEMIAQVQEEIKNESENLEEHREEREKLIANWKVIKDSNPHAIDPNCPECGQPRPAEQIEKLKENFNADKAKRLTENVARGKDIKSEIEKIEKLLEILRAQLGALEEVEPDPILRLVSNTEIGQLKNEIIKLQSTAPAEQPPELAAELEAAKQALTEAQETKAATKATSGNQARIDELNKKKAELATEVDKIEKFLICYAIFSSKMAEATEAPVNELFEIARFKMFKTQEDGKTVDTCELQDIAGRPYAGALSNGEKIEIGLDIVRTMQKEFSISAPVWIDNAESYTSKIDMDCQTIELHADTKHAKLTKEV